jgi:hypothetical protein
LEIWKDIEGYESLYQVSNLGRVKSLERVVGCGNKMIRVNEKIRKLNPNGNGYLNLLLHKEGVKKAFRVHRLVAEAFIPNPNNLPEVNHKDGDKLNNTVDNLEWCTKSHNETHARKTGLKTFDSICKSVVRVEDGKVYKSIAQASKDIGVHRETVSQSIYKGCKAGGYTFRFATEVQVN